MWCATKRARCRKALVMSRGAIAVTAILLAILAATIWWAWQGWTSHADVQMSVHGYIAMGLGVFFSLLIGCGLMALTFYSSRQGYDNLPQAKVKERSGNGPDARNIL
jgi:TRAP-type C4-dicarboxylate transport system permease small subunit